MRRVILMGASILAVASACKRTGTAPPVSGTTLADSAEQVMFNIHFVLTDKGVARGELFADTAYIFDENRRYDLRKVRTTFNTSTGAKDGVMSADRGKYSLNQQVLEGYGNVVIITNDGRKLTSPHLRYMQGLNEVASDSAFTLVKPDGTLSGIGFKSDPQLTRFQVFNRMRVKGGFTLPGQ
ncbi:MAG: LPS export ABC transporter periplasmic protein LptC [Gemmatimonadaceae bacterium]